jgi:hypothetical protein
MNLVTIKVFYWTTFGLSIIILPLNFGLGLVAMGLVILPLLILHLTIGLRVNRLENNIVSIFLSAVNLLLFALIRPDGVHAITDNGLSSALDIFGINAGYNRNYENHFFIGSFILLLVQVIIWTFDYGK